MSTRSIVTIKDETDTVHIFKHYDGYPEGIADAIQNTVKSGLAWDLPRFEADEFAAAFAAANKTQGGGIRIVSKRRAFCDVEYGYTVTQKDGELHIVATSINGWDVWKEKQIFKGNLESFLAFAGKLEA